jgi:uncharacterized damage-inducible protein DinB
MCGEDEYYFTTIESVFEFILNLDKAYMNDLKLTTDEVSKFHQRVNGQSQTIDDLLTLSFEESKQMEKDFTNDPGLFTETDEVQPKSVVEVRQVEDASKLLATFR